MTSFFGALVTCHLSWIGREEIPDQTVVRGPVNIVGVFGLGFWVAKTATTGLCHGSLVSVPWSQ
jgi:hypothetical protein